MNQDKHRFSVAEGTDLNPVAFRAFGRLCYVEREFPGYAQSTILLDASTEDVVLVLPREISPGDITTMVHQAHSWWFTGYCDGRAATQADVRRAIGVQS